MGHDNTVAASPLLPGRNNSAMTTSDKPFSIHRSIKFNQSKEINFSYTSTITVDIFIAYKSNNGRDLEKLDLHEGWACGLKTFEKVLNNSLPSFCAIGEVEPGS